MEETISKHLMDFVSTDPRNSLVAHGGMTIYDPPLVAFALADDPLFVKLKDPDVVGPDHLLPQEWMAGARTVVSYFLPFTKEVRRSNRSLGLPSEEWVSSRIDGESFNDAARRTLISLVEELGGQGVAPVLDSKFTVTNVQSNWSERHVAHIAGLGTFGLHKNLITAKGCAGRYGSVVTTLDLTPTRRPYTAYFEYCPWLATGECGECMKRCPSGAITPQGKNKWVCKNYIDNTIRPKFKPRYGCAKCQIAVPCEQGIPESIK
ncbi:4Fe-4S ferredoxin [Clostridiales bacterium PH28_bin88]|nr:4Fe-4S ferredoxin [Clostridiales bacterium PH28_bin88]